jgi:neutral ceramidase
VRQSFVLASRPVVGTVKRPRHTHAVAAPGVFIRYALGLALTLAAFGCSSPFREPASPSAAPVPAAGLRAGVGEVDITPPAGLSLFGWGPEGRVARGHRGRLRCRSLYVVDRRGESLAWVVCDLSAPSALLHARVAQRLRERIGLGADRLLLSATHTHAAPAHYFGNRSYSAQLSTQAPGFDENVLGFLVERIASSVASAHQDAQAGGEARLSWHFGALSSGTTKNRSLEAHCKNPKPMADVASACGHIGASAWEVDRRLSVLRVERGAAGDGKLVGLFAVVAVHPTTIPNTNELYHADVFGVATRQLRYRLADHPIAAIASGIAGDVSPMVSQQSWAEAERLGRQLAADVERVSLLPSYTPSLDVARSYREVTLRGPELCAEGAVGNAAAGGAEDGRTRYYAVPVAREGAKLAEPEGCHGNKRAWSKPVTKGPWAFPRFAPLLAARLGGVTLVGLPFEPTTTPGLQLRHELEQRTGQPVVFVGLSNEYLQYVTSAEEYAEQHYEGASVIYGPGSAAFFAKHIRGLILGFTEPEKVPGLNQTRAHEFNPTPRVSRLLPAEPERPRQIVRQPFQVDFTRVDMSVEWRVQDSSFFDDDGRETNIAEGPLVRVETLGADGKWTVLTDDLGAPVDDTGTSLWVAQRRRRGNYYSAVWQPPRNLTGRFRFVIGRSAGVVRSQEFSL